MSDHTIRQMLSDLQAVVVEESEARSRPTGAAAASWCPDELRLPPLPAEPLDDRSHAHHPLAWSFSMPTVTARGPLKVVAVIDPAELLDVPVPEGKPRVVLTVRLPDGVVTADLAAKSVRRAIIAVCKHGPEAVAAIVQGRLVGNQITEGGIMVQPKVVKPAEKEAA